VSPLLDIAAIVVVGALFAIIVVALAPFALIYITYTNWKEWTQ